MTETPSDLRQRSLFRQYRRAEPDVNPQKLARKARVATDFEAEYARFLDDEAPFPIELAAALLDCDPADVELHEAPTCGGRVTARGLQDWRGYLLIDSGRLLDLLGLDGSGRWSDDHRPWIPEYQMPALDEGAW
ncbi:hypothetical protein J8M97_14360 [Gordonia polyisoprenivorans]|uniref:hypothetical protein n=1 Tax=Gordonia polyisoprenivorans TaxID=84595 RepID=UPI000B99F2C7|nr:hypothetical protein [Gordonia polyisoprenivorans]OZC29935.1 hypothetical protein CJJ17_25110 [Gordonia polyisoprenivorans]QUD81032.1 hypothetical protein J8M97_14360 [Gordonia polyisoprenivorans]